MNWIRQIRLAFKAEREIRLRQTLRGVDSECPLKQIEYYEQRRTEIIKTQSMLTDMLNETEEYLSLHRVEQVDSLPNNQAVTKS